MNEAKLNLNEPLAIVGLGLRYPGARTAESYWENIVQKRCFVKHQSAINKEIASVYSPDPSHWNRAQTDLAASLDSEEFPTRRFRRFPPLAAEASDTYIQYSLLAAQDAIDSAGERAFAGRFEKTFVAVGHYNYETRAIQYLSDQAQQVFVEDIRKTQAFQSLTQIEQEQLIKKVEDDFLKGGKPLPLDTLTATMASAMLSRLTKSNQFTGGYVTVDSACASSFAALDVAARRLRDQSSDVAVVGGIGVISPYFFVHCSKAHTMSADGCFPFDQRANGFVPGEGAGFIVVKRLSTALQDGDSIHAVIRGIGSSSDGAKRGVWAPNKAGQKRAIQAALDQAGYSFSEISYVESHGTGTLVGDREEVFALNDLYQQSARKDRIPIGSVKGAIGHQLPGAGMAGLLRVLMAIKNKKIPSTVGHEKPIDQLKSSPFFIPIEGSSDWELYPGQNTRRAMINSFGYGGTNYNVQIEEYSPEFHKKYLLAPDEFAPLWKSWRPIEEATLECLNEKIYNVPAAVVGVGVHLPGVSHYGDLHAFCAEGRSGLSAAPEGRFNSEQQDKLRKNSDKKNAFGGYVRLPTAEEKASWKISPVEIPDIDPNQFRLFNVVKEALENSGLLDQPEVLAKTAMVCGVMIDSEFFGQEQGSLGFVRLQQFLRDNTPRNLGVELSNELHQECEKFLYTMTKDTAAAGIDSMLGSRIAKFFDMGAGSLSMDGVCATGVLAMDHALRRLRSGELEAVVVCSSTMSMSAQMNDLYNDLTGGWAEEGSHPFSIDRKGFALGEGAVAFVLRPLNKVMKQTESVLALIHAAGISCDGTTAQLLQPSLTTARQAFLTCQAQAPSLRPLEFTVIECHGIGTPASDEVEVELCRELCSRPGSPLTLGSFKGAIGHLRVTSAFATIARAVSSLQTRTLYPTVGLGIPAPSLTQDPQRPLQVLRAAQPMTLAANQTSNQTTIQTMTQAIGPLQNQYSPDRQAENEWAFAAVSSFGLGGINGHLILSEMPPRYRQQKVLSPRSAPLISGSPRARGFKLGQMWRESVTIDTERVWRRLPQDFFTEGATIIEHFLSGIPAENHEEMRGIAEGSGFDLDMVLRFNSLTMAVTSRYGLCSGFVKKTSKSFYHGCNYDFPFVTSRDNEFLPRAVLQFESPNCFPFLGVFLLGTAFPYGGINSKGLSVSSSAGAPLGSVTEGMFVYALIRLILETCVTLADAEALIVSTSVSGAWSLLVSSKADGESLLAEVSGDRHFCQRTKFGVAANHFVHLPELLAPRADSLFRHLRVAELSLADINGMSQAQKILGDMFDIERNKVTRFSTANTVNRYNTAVSAVFDVENLRASISCSIIPSGLGPYIEYEIFDSGLSAFAQQATQEMSRDIKRTALLTRVLGEPFSLPTEMNTEKILVLLGADDVISGELDSSDLHSSDLKKGYLEQLTKLSEGRIVRYFSEPMEMQSSEAQLSGTYVVLDASGLFSQNLEAEKYWKKIVWLQGYLRSQPIKISRVFTAGIDHSILGSKSDSEFQIQTSFWKSFARELNVEAFGLFLGSHREVDAGTLARAMTAIESIQRTVSKSIDEIGQSKDAFVFNGKIRFLENARTFVQKNSSSIDAKVHVIAGGTAEILQGVIAKILAERPMDKLFLLCRNDTAQLIHAEPMSLNDFVKKNLSEAKSGVLEKPIVLKEKYRNYLKSLRLGKLKAEYPEQVVILRVDLADVKQVREAIASIRNQESQIDEFVFASGIEKSKSFLKANLEELKSVFTAKATAFQNCLNELQAFPPVRIVVLSSMAALVGSEGQSVYAAANSFLAAEIRRQQKLFPFTDWVNLFLSAWDGVGMASDPALKKVLEAKGFVYLNPNSATEMMYEILNGQVDVRDAQFLNSYSPEVERTRILTNTFGCYKVYATNWSETDLVLNDHIVKGRVTVPGAFWLDWVQRCMVAENPVTVEFNQVEYLSLGQMVADNTMMTVLRVQPLDRHLNWSIQQPQFSFQSGQLLQESRELCRGKVVLKSKVDSQTQPDGDVNTLNLMLGDWQDNGANIYERLHKNWDGRLGPNFQVIKRTAKISEKEFLLDVQLPRATAYSLGLLLDSMNQGAVLFAGLLNKEFNFLPHSIGKLEISEDFSKAEYFIVKIELTHDAAAGFTFNADFFDKSSGARVIRAHDVAHRLISKKQEKGVNDEFVAKFH